MSGAWEDVEAANSQRLRTPAIWGSKEERERLKSTCHWLSK